MDDIIFYGPPSTSRSQTSYLPVAPTSSNTSRASSITPSCVRQTASDLNQWNGISKDRMTISRDVSDLSQQGHFWDQRCRNDITEEQDSMGTRNSDSDDDDFPEIDGILSGMVRKNHPVYTGRDSRGDDNFVDEDELLSSVEQESIPASAVPGSEGTARGFGSRARRGNPIVPFRSAKGSSKDPITLSDDESVGAEFENDFSDFDIDTRASSDSGHPYGEGELADGDGIAHALGHHTNSVASDPQLRLSAEHPASESCGSVTHQASELRMYAEVTQESTRYVNLGATKGLRGGKCSTSAEGIDEDDEDDHSARSTSSAVSSDNLALDGNMSRPQDGQPHAQVPQPGLAVESFHQSDLNDSLPEQPRRPGATGKACREHPRPTAPVRLPSNADTVFATEVHHHAYAGAPILNWDSNGARKRARRMKNMEDDDVAALSTRSHNTSCEAAIATSSSGTHESEEIPIHGYLTLKTVDSKVVYCLTFSQEVLLLPRDRRQKQASTTEFEAPQSAASVADPDHHWGIRKIIDQKMVGCEKHYRVEWNETWMPESELAEAKELVDAFKANEGSEISDRKRPLNRGRLATGQPDALGKKRRGRPRKQ
ncbi:hypothetical protein N431DRAFT_456560 [Stipitochalara longipes BDJ]|nr:hypothetical protein N431DRAFT_456560 [Stipitochalara longipes BDJ]